MGTMKRKLAWVCLLVSPLVIGGAAFCFIERDPISRGNCDRIKEGMTLKEVEAILGREADGVLKLGLCYRWEGSRGQIFVHMAGTEPNFVETALFVKDPPQTIREKIRDWLDF
jgi:hypothetical protein